jgi:hypothetical protein
MAARGPGVVRHGTARDLADKAMGYVASGTSEHTRQISHANIKLGDGKRTDGRLLRETAKELAKLEHKLTCETDPVRRAKCAKNVSIKRSFLAKIEKQLADEHPNEPKVKTRNWITNLPGENDFEPWDKVR